MSLTDRLFGRRACPAPIQESPAIRLMDRNSERLDVLLAEARSLLAVQPPAPPVVPLPHHAPHHHPHRTKRVGHG